MLAAGRVFPLVAALLLVGCNAERPGGRAELQRPPGSADTAGPAAGAAAPASAQPQAVETRYAPQGLTRNVRLCLELDAPRPKVQLGEPVTVIASLVNCSSVPQQVDDLLSPYFGFLQVWIQPPQGPEKIHRPTVSLDTRGPQRTLAPGERLSTFVPVYFGPEGWVMKQPGPYRIRAEFGVETTRLESKPVLVTVLEPQNAIDRQAAELMMTPEAGMFLATGRDKSGEGSRRLTILQQEYPGSLLAPYARLALAVAESRDGFDPKTKTFRNDGCVRATDQLARAVPEVRDLHLAATGAASWVNCLRKTGRDAEVKSAISLFFRSHPEAKAMASVAQSLDTPSRKD